MKSLFPLAAAFAVLMTAAQALAALPNQPAVIPADGEYGVYAVQSQLAGPADPDLAKAYDNFSISGDYTITGFSWAGVYAEPLPADPSDTDFIVQIWNIDPSNDNKADVHNGPIYTFNFEGGVDAGTGGSDLMVTPLGHVSTSTNATQGGGPDYSYYGDVAPVSLAAGDYWISILANQLFSNPDPIIDPEWQWHLGSGPGDGFTDFDRTLDPPGTLQAGILEPGKDLAFRIHGVPEPTGAILAALGLASLGMVRRKRS